MGQMREVDAISDAIVATEREIAGDAWGVEDTDAIDASGDRSLEAIGEGLEGQHETDDEAPEADEADGDAESGETDDEGEAEAEDEPTTDEEPEPPVKPAARTEPEGRIPSARLREANEAKRAAEAERDALKAQIEKSKGDTTSLAERLDLVMRELSELKRGPRPEAKTEPAKVEAVPDLFEDPTGFANHLTRSFQTELSKRDQLLAAQRVETSMAIAHALHKETFEQAFAAINQLNPSNPDDRVTVQRIYASPNPGDALVSWHRRSQALKRVGDDPDAYEARIREETRQALLQDPEFRKSLVAELRGEAASPGPDGKPRTTTRLPKSLARAGGSNLGADRVDPHARDDSDQSVADAAWR
jgi:hypothetical protein